MNTKLSFKTIVFVCIAVLTFSIAGIHARVKSVEPNNEVKEVKEPLQVINPVSKTKDDQKPIQENIPEPEAVDEADKVQSIPNTETIPQKELPAKPMQENKEPVMVMASVDTKTMNKIEKPMDTVDVQSSDESAVIKDQAENLVLTQNETVENQDSKQTTVPDNAVQNDIPKDTSNDPKEVDIDNAIADLSKQIELNDSDAGLYVFRGNLYMDKQDYEKAINDYTKAIEIKPDDVTAYNNRGLAYVNMGKYNNHVKFQQAIKDSKQADQFFKKAIKDFTKAIKIDPENIFAYINRGNAYHVRYQNQKKAISDYTRAIKIDPEFSLAYINRGNTYLQERNFNKAINDFSKALELNVKDTGIYLLRGNAYYSNREYSRAINDYSKALEINPDLINAYNNRGVAFEHMGELDKAISDFSRVIELDPNNTLAYKNRSEVYRKMGNKIEYENDLNMAKKYEYKVQMTDDIVSRLAKHNMVYYGNYYGSILNGEFPYVEKEYKYLPDHNPNVWD